VNEYDVARRDEDDVAQLLCEHPVAVAVIEVDVSGDLQPLARAAGDAAGEVKGRTPSACYPFDPTTRWFPQTTMADDALTTGLAIWGAIVSTGLAVLRVLDYRRDRPVIVVRLSSMRVRFKRPRSPLLREAFLADGTMLLVEVANRGRGTARITDILMMLHRGRPDASLSPL
jgi:hypothetical protein